MSPVDLLLGLGPLLAIALVSLFVSGLITLIYRFTTDQKHLEQIKQDMERLRGELKGQKDAKKLGEINKQMMEKTFEQLRATMRPMFITMVPALLILGWMQGALAFEQVRPGEEFTTTAIFSKGAQGEVELAVPEGVELLSPARQPASDSVIWKLKGKEGSHRLQYLYNSEAYELDVLVTGRWKYLDPVLEQEKSFLGINTGDRFPIKKGSAVQKISIDLKGVSVVNLGFLSIGWLVTYIIFSVAFSMLLRKAFKVH